MNRGAREERLLRQFGDRLRELREGAGLTQEQLAERSGLHRTYIGGCERGQRNVSLVNLVVIANALESSVASLLGPGEQGWNEPVVVRLRRPRKASQQSTS